MAGQSVLYIRVPYELKELLEKAAASTGKSQNTIVVEAIQAKLKEESKMIKANCEISEITVDGIKYAILEDDNDKIAFAWDDRFDDGVYWDEYEGYIFKDKTPVMSLPAVDIEL